MPTKDNLFQEFKGKGLAVLAISFKESEDLVKDFQKEFKLSFPVLFDTHGNESAKYEITGHPVTFLIDRKGFLIGKVVGERDWSSLDAQALARELLKTNPRSKRLAENIRPTKTATKEGKVGRR